MSDVRVRDFTDRCLIALPGIPVPLCNRYVVDAARELQRVGRVWRHSFMDIPLDGEGSYPLAPLPNLAVLHDIDVVKINGRPVDPFSRGASRMESQGMRRGVTSVRWTRDGDGIELRFGHPSGLLDVQTVLISVTNTTALPQILWDEWIESIEHGVKAKAMLTQNKRYTNPELGADHRSQWLDALAGARSYGRAGGATARRRSVDPWA